MTREQLKEAGFVDALWEFRDLILEGRSKRDALDWVASKHELTSEEVKWLEKKEGVV